MKRPDRPWFESDQLDAYLARAGLDTETEAWVRTLARDGYVVVDLGDEARRLCDQAVAETEAYFEDPKVARIQDAWLRSSAVRKLADWPRIGQILKAAYGRKGFPFQTLNFKYGSQQSLHTDAIHFHSAPERFMCGVWLALEDVQPGAGPLVYHPGSHRLPVMSMRDAGVNRPDPTPQDYETHFVPRFAERIAAAGLPQHEAVIRKGQALIWAANLAHGGSAITEAGATRRSLVTHWYFEGCLYYTPMTSDVEKGRYDLRAPANIHTGGWAWPNYNGRPAWPGLKRLINAAYVSLRRRPHLG